MLGFIGGSGIYEALSLTNMREERIETPYGVPSAPITVGQLEGADDEIAFLPRHGQRHEFGPTEVPYRANIYALKRLGVTRILSSNAVGSLREDLPPRTLVVPDQLFDRTRHRSYSFFEGGVTVHMGFADPYCPHVASHLAESARDAAGATVVDDGTYVCIEGPQFSTRAESEFYRSQGWDVIGMTAIPEAKLAREAELCYATLAGVTDYDVWRTGSEVSLEEVLDNAAANEDAIRRTIQRAARTMPETRECDCSTALDGAINTPTDAIPPDVRSRIDLLAGKYL